MLGVLVALVLVLRLDLPWLELLKPWILLFLFEWGSSLLIFLIILRRMFKRVFFLLMWFLVCFLFLGLCMNPVGFLPFSRVIVRTNFIDCVWCLCLERTFLNFFLFSSPLLFFCYFLVQLIGDKCLFINVLLFWFFLGLFLGNIRLLLICFLLGHPWYLLCGRKLILCLFLFLTHLSVVVWLPWPSLSFHRRCYLPHIVSDISIWFFILFFGSLGSREPEKESSLVHFLQ